MSISQKYNDIKNHKLCSNCLRAGHFKQECKLSGCKKCSYKHKRLINNEKKRDSPIKVSITVIAEVGTLEIMIYHKRWCLCESEVETDNANNVRNTYRQKREIHETNFMTFSSNQVFLSTANVLIKESSRIWRNCYALLDSESQSNLISKSLYLKKKLNFKCDNFKAPLSGINQIITTTNKNIYNDLIKI